MQKLYFCENKTITIGVELEIQLIDPATGDLKPVAPTILHKINNDLKYPHIKSEIFQSMLEIDTPICTNAHEAGASLRTSFDIARSIAAESDAKIIMAGTHPFAHYSERLLTPSSRYYDLVDRNQWITRRLQIFGLHIHLGMRNGDHAIAINNALCHYLPLILAISASSPFWKREDTGLASSRITFFEAIPTGGHPYLINNWTDFESLIQKLILSKSITSIKDLWWDIRPNIEFGTIEVRIADCPATIKEAEAIVALVHSLALFIDDELTAGRKFSPPPEWILRENKWRTSRHGTDSLLILDNQGSTLSFERVWESLKKDLAIISHKNHYQHYFNFIDQIIKKGPSYLRQRKAQKSGFEYLINHLIKENELDTPLWT